MGKKDQDGFKEKKIRRKGEGKRSEKEREEYKKGKCGLWRGRWG